MRTFVPFRVFSHWCALTLVCGAAVQESAAQQPRQRATALVYDVELAARTPQAIWHHLLYDKGKFRDEIHYSTAHLKRPVYVELSDGSKPYIVWSCNLQEMKASPLPDSCRNALGAAAKRDGTEAVRLRYHVPRALHIFPIAEQPPRSSSVLRTKSEFARLTGPEAARETVAGYACELYRSSVALRVETSRDDMPGSRMIQQTHEVRAWVEPRTGLVLRLEERQIAAPASPAAPFVTGYMVTKLRLPASIPREQFQLPPGTTAYLGRIFSGVVLPHGVKRVTPPGIAGDIGMDIKP